MTEDTVEFVDNATIFIIELELALLHIVSPGICGSSGTVRKNLSTALLNFKMLVFDKLRTAFGRALNRRAPCIGRLASRNLFILALALITGMKHLRP